MVSPISSDEGDLGFQIAPMVDIVFVLMLFFMACVSFQSREFIIQSSVPTPSHPGTSTVAIDVEIAIDGNVYIQNQLIAATDNKTLDSLIEWLDLARRSFGAKDPVFVSAAPTVNHERVMDVLNAVDKAN